MDKLKNESTDRLFRTILNLKTLEECYSYFEDLCTIKELQDMAQRLDTAILLSQGYSYQKIQESIDISTATIGRVSKCLNYGTGGYRDAINKLKELEYVERICENVGNISLNGNGNILSQLTAILNGNNV